MTGPWGEPADVLPGDVDDHEHLFAAAEGVDPGVIDATPWVALGGYRVDDGTGLPTLPPQIKVPGVLSIDGLTVTWGRDSVLDHPEPATGVLQLFATSRRFAYDRDLRGELVELGWTCPIPGTSSQQTYCYYRGRVGNQAGSVKVEPKTIWRNGVRYDGALVTLQLQSLLVDLANRTPGIDWPAENVEARRARLLSESYGVLTDLIIRDYWLNAPLAAVPANEQVSILDHLYDLMQSCGADRMTFWPDDRVLRYQTRRDYPAYNSLGQLWWHVNTETASRVNKGAFARARAVQPVPGGPIGWPGWLDAAELAYDPTDGLLQGPRYTRAQVNHVDNGNDYADRSIWAYVGDVDENLSGERTASVDSLLAQNDWAQVQLHDFEELVRNEASAWSIAPVRFNAGKAGGFAHLEMVKYLLAGAETNTLILLQRSRLPWFGIRPVFGVMGGTFTYTDGGWDLELTLGPANTTGFAQHMLAWDEIDTGLSQHEIRWHDVDNIRGFHESLTYEDMAYVGMGLGQTSAPIQTRWDEWQ